MSIKKRLIAVIVVLCLAGGAAALALSGMPISEKREESTQEAEVILPGGKQTIYLWYTDEALTDYLTSAAVAYTENKDIRIVPVLEPGLEYLENINSSSVETNQPDLYILSHDSLEKAYLAGLATEVVPTRHTTMEDTYPQAALSAVTFQEKLLGYPFYFETNTLLYNKTYLRQEAQKQLQEEAQLAAAESESAQDTTEGAQDTTESAQDTTESAQDTAESTGNTADTASAADTSEDEAMPDIEEAVETKDLSELSEEELAVIDQRVEEILPSTIDDIREFADSYDAPEQVEAVFKWDVTDIFYNYFFVGDAITLGGEAGWDTSDIHIYNEQAIANMKVYQELNQFFSVDTDEISYDGIIDDFVAGKLLFTVATSDAVAKLEQAKSDGLFTCDYGFTQTPDISETMPTRSLSMTQCVVVNGYSSYQEIANDFAYFLTVDYADILYGRSGKVAAASKIENENDALDVFVAEYANSIPMPKMIETSNFWVELEVAFAQIWDGADVNEQLKSLSEKIKTQISGEDVIEEQIEEASEEETTIEYLDEEALREEAQQQNAASEE